MLASLRQVIWRTLDLSAASIGCGHSGFEKLSDSCTRFARLVAAACAAAGDAGVETLDISGHNCLTLYHLYNKDEWVGDPF